MNSVASSMADLLLSSSLWVTYFQMASCIQRYLDHDDDLVVCLAVRDKADGKTPIRRLRTLGFWRKKRHDADADADINHFVSYYSDKRIDGFASALIASVGIALLIAPIWTLKVMDSLTNKLVVVITVFVLVFLLILSFAMVAKPFEALGATAAYAAVLMVFIQVGDDGRPS
ncbi:hypothetical protein B0H66DRAFT_599651 [Apodospora peruviana]|uniref:DUF6594 domain-containing protein n=1 Tax=Apodospora peruviana TaxID=516989 RepID=A0AAE0II21_9PEZI|nr:hypothetical protein B0H66DRAFT_599651 [Apodospora peruviana]